MILLLTRPLDPTADMVIRELGATGTPVVRMDPGDLPRSIELTGRFEQGRWHGRLRDEHREADLAEVSAVYNRRPNLPRAAAPGIRPEDAEWASNECYEGMYGVLYSLPALWLNRPDHNRTASLKALQLSVAHDCGLPGPTTLVTNSPADAKEFVSEEPSVIKTLRGVPQRDADGTPGHPLVVYTWQVSPHEVNDTVSQGLCQFQRRIVPHYEVRLIAVGTQMFAARIDSPSGRDGETTDWRAYQLTDRISYTPLDVPDAIRHGVLAYLAAFQLHYGAFDFMVDDDGWHFLEMNPNGQFAFVEYATGQPIARAIADLLRQADAEHATTRSG
ncbi:MvdC/MvdD family ATP grasp protein [Streptomyces acidiscabies]|uniref:ATP-grasp ribosomal peptide maturase n=1 Tax=Streptomyces acidiscabies TaxID=42234 RepID=A0ABU4MD68_9ACTN|nr:ATP-grasp ribosomal peptide maturase [Streptomyces acidiscabies]MDX3025945.1 ATP-grasp ribosomal peptide maturase [Streptomyces acidiscabies]